jgi:hypothetical protein
MGLQTMKELKEEEQRLRNLYWLLNGKNGKPLVQSNLGDIPS